MKPDLFVDVILPLPLPRLFTYWVPPEMAGGLEQGIRVVVPFGKKKQYSGIIFSLHHNNPESYQTKPLLAVLERTPIVNQQQLDFWQWLADYYQCTLGEVYKAALPSGLKLESETRVYYNPHYEQTSDLSDKAQKVLAFLEQKKNCSVSEINDHLQQKSCLHILQPLIEDGAVFVSEQLKDSYRPKTENYLTIAPAWRTEEALQQAFEKLDKAPRQLNLLMGFIQKCGGTGNAIKGESVARKDLLAGDNNAAAPLKEIIKKGIFEQFARETGRLDKSEGPIEEKNTFSLAQSEAYEKILQSFENHEVVLFHGVTSSGKTELYIHLIEKHLARGEQVLYLLPEIALTTQITTRLKRHFANKLGIYHSKFSSEERVEVYRDLLEEKNYQVILGVRSSIFLPFSHLGLIIVDEEHEHSFKQFDPAPRYHARDAGIMLAHKQGAKVLLGTATPSIESYYNAKKGKYGLVELHSRFEDIKLPDILVADTREARRKKQMKSHFTPLLLEHTKAALERNEQVILFQNRRGFSPFVECETCGWVPRCKFCDVSMTYHKKMNHLVCHYCGHTVTMPQTCQACGSPGLSTKGFGTEKIEEEIRLLFPESRVSRMDYDTTRSKKSYQNIISEFETGAVDILIGTQMVSKGLDFDRVSVVGILNADNMLNIPDFRAFERSFQMMAQVSGRAGRKNKQGTVILQTANPDHPIIQYVINNDYESMYRTQIEERQMFKYPPFYRLMHIMLRHKDKRTVDNAAESLAGRLRAIMGERVLGPQEPPVSKVRNQYLTRIILKFEKGHAPSHVKKLVNDTIDDILSTQQWRYVTVQKDVDPM